MTETQNRGLDAGVRRKIMEIEMFHELGVRRVLASFSFGAVFSDNFHRFHLFLPDSLSFIVVDITTTLI